MNDTKIKTERIDDVPLLIAHQKNGYPQFDRQAFQSTW